MMGWWQGLTVLGKAVTAVSAAVLVVIAGAGVATNHFSLPHRNLETLKTVTVEVREVREEQRDISHELELMQLEQKSTNQKLDRVLCILEGANPLTCERIP